MFGFLFNFAFAGGPSDQELITRLSAGDQKAARLLYDRHIKLVWSLVVRILKDSAEAEEVVQELFVRVWQHCRLYDSSRGEVGAWLTRMARTMAIDRLRSTTSRAVRESSYGEESEIQTSANAEDHLEWTQVRKVIGELPIEQRTLIEQAYFEGLSQTELAERHALPLGTVKTRLRTGMMTLRKIWLGT